MRRPPKLMGRRFGRLSTLLLVLDVWRRIPPKQRKRLLTQARKHGLRLAKRAYKARRR